MRTSGVSVSMTAVLAASLASAQYLINELSFGATGHIIASGSPATIPGFKITGQPSSVSIYSNKVILTPPSTGNQRASIWAETPLTNAAWTTDVDFRATGGDRGSGNLNVWLVNGGDRDVGTSSIYTVGRFDGLGLVIDAHGGSGGMIRGFLNDGTVDYSMHHNVDELAFGHCLYSYRNLGRPSQLKMRQTGNMFQVEVDGTLCFESDKFSLPPGNQLGITAATSDNPDSFEVFKLAVMADSSQYAANSINQQQGQYQQQQKIPKQNPYGQNPGSGGGDDGFEEPADEDPEVFSSSLAQFADLHNRLQAATHQVSAVYRTASRHASSDERRHAEVKELLAEMRGELGKLDQLVELQRRISDLEREIRGVRGELGSRMTANERAFQGSLKDHHATLSQALLDSVPGHGRIVVVFLATQVILVVAYVVYKRRKSIGARKYL